MRTYMTKKSTQTNVPSPVSATHASISTAERPTSPLNAFDVFNVNGLKPRSVPSKVPFMQDELNAENKLFSILTET